MSTGNLFHTTPVRRLSGLVVRAFACEAW